MIIVHLISNDYILHIYTADDSALKKQKTLLEAKYGSIGQYTYRIDPPHNSENGQKHLHGFLKGKEIFSINQDGSAHDGWHQTWIPRKFIEALPKIFKGINVPQNGLLECDNINHAVDSLIDDAEFCQAVDLKNEVEKNIKSKEWEEEVINKAAIILDNLDN